MFWKRKPTREEALEKYRLAHDRQLAEARGFFADMVNVQLSAGISRQYIWNSLMAMQLWKLEELQARSEAERAVFTVMLDRNLNGISLERAGEVDQAVELYEANVKDEFCGSHPYERLRVIYTKRKDYTNAIRVCQAFLKTCGPNERPVDPKKKARFEEHIEKLKTKLSDSGASN